MVGKLWISPLIWHQAIKIWRILQAVRIFRTRWNRNVSLFWDLVICTLHNAEHTLPGISTHLHQTLFRICSLSTACTPDQVHTWNRRFKWQCHFMPKCYQQPHLHLGRATVLCCLQKRFPSTSQKPPLKGSEHSWQERQDGWNLCSINKYFCVLSWELTKNGVRKNDWTLRQYVNVL